MSPLNPETKSARLRKHWGWGYEDSAPLRPPGAVARRARGASGGGAAAPRPPPQSAYLMTRNLTGGEVPKFWFTPLRLQIVYRRFSVGALMLPRKLISAVIATQASGGVTIT